MEKKILNNLYQYLLLSVFSFKIRRQRKWCFFTLKYFVTKTDQTKSSTITQTLQLKFRLLSKCDRTTKNNHLNTNTVKFQTTVSDIVSINLQTQCSAMLSLFVENSFSTPVKINSFSHKLLHALRALSVFFFVKITVSDIVSIDMQTQCSAMLSSLFVENSFSRPVKINSFSHKLLHALHTLSVLCYLAH